MNSDNPGHSGSRHRGGSDDDAARRRYFTEVDPAGRPSTRHRRRREDGDTTPQIWQTGQVPRVDDNVDEATGRVLPQRIAPGEQVGSQVAPEATTSHNITPSVRRRPSAPTDQFADDSTRFAAQSHESALYEDTVVDEPAAAVSPAPAGVAAEPLVDDDVDFHDLPPVNRQAYSEVASDTEDAPFGDEPPAYPFDHLDSEDSEEQSARSPKRRKRIVLAVVLVCLLAMLGGVGYYGLRFLGIVGAKDYTNAAGTSDVLVTIPQDASLRDFGQILTDKHVVGSVKAFTRAADGKTLAAGIYKLRTEIPASKAVQMLDDSGMSYRVGRLVVPEGVQLDSKTGVDGKVTKGIFQLIAEATSATVNGEQIGVSADALAKAAADDTPEQLNIPQWARTEVKALTGDHRRVEGLIAPGTWETIDPSATPTDILRKLVTDSAARYEQWGVLSANNSGLSPYETLVAASMVEREVSNASDFAKVARVILNRLAIGQRLQMDSTANYTAAITNIDVHGDAYKADNEWNTYHVKGLPPTPIASVGQAALEAMEQPAVGKWLYFITVDKAGTTLFADTFDEHKKNREQACANKFLSVGCH